MSLQSRAGVERKEFRDLFKKIDTDGSGSISREELRTG